MGHNYAKPLTAEARMERVFSRLPADWAVKMERQPGTGWSVWMQRPDGTPHQETRDTLVEALEEVWRALR
ncbi:hypothetical protein HKD27_02710 [Gluconobacter sp. R75690]|uniref:hypothetical protein n=1 Tax=Gluconobacter TaxID=441 RepID=UPI00188A5DF6|nr:MULTISPECIES: hypothetical protein [unclassified Gluconobacter]MBF0849835.1 hypothetical protein [Gluconobacter sp. R75690]MBF0878718.1 hypothetical protein [Gluconobacter sp. R75828]